MPKLKVITLPDKRLREKSKDIKEKDIKKLFDFFSNLADAMYDYDGIGIASVQVGELMRAVFISTDEGPLLLINPKIIKYSKETEVSDEGCLSVPKIFGPVRRSKTLKVEAIDETGKKIKFQATELFARVIQHEVDHTNGILFVDILEKDEKK